MFPSATVFPAGLAIGSSFDMPLVEIYRRASVRIPPLKTFEFLPWYTAAALWPPFLESVCG